MQTEPSPETIRIERFHADDTDGIIGLILPIQQDEFGIAITAEAQPDLREIETFYQTGNGDFWVAKTQGKVVGTIGLKDIGNGNTALRKMFVAAEYRGRPFQVAHRLLTTLLEAAKIRGVKTVYLGTTDKFIGAHKFYEKNGFAEIGPETLPVEFPRMAVDTKFYCIQTGG